ncbi:MAG: hypothetical protein NTX30_06020 [Deltaproteobacteria bacterium]|nr:hypothetical protein [Deltaproteobacteria bacterium]
MPIVPIGFQSRRTLGEGRGNAFIMFLKEGRKEIAGEARNSREDPGASEETIPEGQAGVAKAAGRR